MDGDKVMIQHVSIGVGCSSRAVSDDVVALILACVGEIVPATILATLDSRGRMGETVAAALGMRLMLFPASALARVTGITTRSQIALRSSGSSSVAEAAALIALGPEARLSLSRRTGRLCTCAVAVLP
ncbi:MAG TPA: cobalamin biosynthesis protein [Edaphobacter sp.]|nr:cobalamin biosynthesis protein [Edaphobacter sp.]